MLSSLGHLLCLPTDRSYCIMRHTLRVQRITPHVLRTNTMGAYRVWSVFVRHVSCNSLY